MIYAIMSDVHSNPDAFSAVLADAQECGVDKIISCGDITGYGYDVKSAMKMLREQVDVHLLGNHDLACVKALDIANLALHDNYGVDRTQRDELTSEELEWLAFCPFLYEDGEIACVHGDFTEPEKFNYILRYEDAAASLKCREENLLFVGHTHAAKIYAMGPHGERATMQPCSFKVQEGWRYLVNVGTVGYPRHDYRLTYFLYDSIKRQVTFRALPFDLQVYIKNLLDRMIPMPPWLTELLMSLKKLHETAH